MTEPFHKLFISVDRHWRGEGVVFQATMKHSSEAVRMVTGGMLPHFMTGIASTRHEALKKCFTLGVVKKASKAVWDAEQRCVISQEDNLLNMLFDCDIDNEYDDAGDDMEPLIIDIENLEPGRQRLKARIQWTRYPLLLCIRINRQSRKSHQ